MVGAVVFVSLVGSAYLYTEAVAAQKDVSGWPSADALIESSRVTQYPAPKAAGDFVQVELRLSYKVDGKTVISNYANKVISSRRVDYREMLSEGNTVSIKYSPRDTSIASLAPLGL